MATKWGCAGAALIAHDFFTAMKENLPAADHQLVAIGARDKKRASEFAQRFGFQRAYGSYQELAEDADIEVVYIGTINTNHNELSEMMMKAGKHVICEKPMALNLKQATKVLSLAKQEKRFFLEAVWSRFLPSYERLRQEMKSGTLGDIRLVDARFCVPIKNVERIARKDMAGGGILDLGIYVVQLACLVFDEKPSKITVEGSLTDTGVDENACILLRYKNGAIANLTYHTDTTMGNNVASIHGTKNWIKLEDPFHSATKLITPSGPVEFPLKDGQYNFENSAGLQYEADAVRQCILKGELESELYPHSQSLMVMEIMDEVRRQLGYSLPADQE